jgi:hypothetical protein
MNIIKNLFYVRMKLTTDILTDVQVSVFSKIFHISNKYMESIVFLYSFKPLAGKMRL